MHTIAALIWPLDAYPDTEHLEYLWFYLDDSIDGSGDSRICGLGPFVVLIYMYWLL